MQDLQKTTPNLTTMSILIWNYNLWFIFAIMLDQHKHTVLYIYPYTSDI